MTVLGCGRQTSWRTMGEGEFTCRNPSCTSHDTHGLAGYHIVQSSDWFRLFGLRLVRLDRGPDSLECQSCGHVLSAANVDAQPMTPCVPVVTGSSRAVDAFSGTNFGADGPVRLIVQPKTPTQRDRCRNEQLRPAARPVASTCGICDTPRSIDDELCKCCGAVFVDRSTRTCDQHRISLPTGVDCLECGPSTSRQAEPAGAARRR